MGWLADLLKDYPALSVVKERLALVEERLRQAEAENKRLKAENTDLRSECAGLKTRVAVATKARQFLEYKGVLWKELDGVVDSISYCPECKLAMSVFPPGSDEMLVCSKCNFTAPFPPSQVSVKAKELEIDLLSA